MSRLSVILIGLLISFGVNAEEEKSLECGAITTYHFGKPSGHIYPALILKVNKRKEINELDLNLHLKLKQNIKLEPGLHTLELIHLIDRRRLKQLHYNKQSYIRRLTINIEPGKVYYIAAKAEWPAGKVRNYWEPVVWKTKAKECKYNEGDFGIRKALKPAAKAITEMSSEQPADASVDSKMENNTDSTKTGFNAGTVQPSTNGISVSAETPLYSSEVLPKSLAVRLNQVLQETYYYLQQNESRSGDNSKSFILMQAAKNIVRLGVLFDWRYNGKTDGVKILGVSPGSLGQDMGLKTGDVIVAFAGHKLTELGKTADDFSEAAIKLFELAQNLKTGEKLQLNVIRLGEGISIDHVITDEFVPAYQLLIGLETGL